MESVFLPFSTSRELKMGTQGSTDCWDDSGGEPRALNAPCAWVQYWVELQSADQAGDYRSYLGNYSDQQRAAGRFERPTNVRLRNVMELLEFNNTVPGDVRLQLWLALGFLLVCLVNTVGLLLAKFLRRSGEIGVRRALGASRGEIFKQCLVEAGAIGLVGGVLGLGLALLGLCRAPATGELCRAGPARCLDVADHLPARRARQPAGRPAARLAGDADHARRAAQEPVTRDQDPSRINTPWNSVPSSPR